ncbi:MAG: RNA polymerase sigma factor [Litoreibacter sp.]
MTSVIPRFADNDPCCVLMSFGPMMSAGILTDWGIACENGVSTVLKRKMIVLLPRLRRFARTLTRSVPEADDLVQDVCLMALRKSQQWDPAQPLDRWLFRIMRNLWISEIRKRKVRFGEGHIPAEESTELVSTETGEAGVAVKQLHGKIASLPSELAAVLLLVSIEGYSYAEAAELLDIPVGTVMSRVHRARKSLAAMISEPEGRGQ